MGESILCLRRRHSHTPDLVSLKGSRKLMRAFFFHFRHEGTFELIHVHGPSGVWDLRQYSNIFAGEKRDARGREGHRR